MKKGYFYVVRGAIGAILYFLPVFLQAQENSDSDLLSSVNVPFDMPVIRTPVFPDRTFDIRDYGAIGDSVTLNTNAFESAITACADAGGGKVLIPKGIWFTGPIHLKSNVNLHIEQGAEVRFSNNPDDYLPVVFTRLEGIECYNYSPLIYAIDCNNIAITGKGVFNGQGEPWWPWKKKQKKAVQELYDSQFNGIPVNSRIYGTQEAALRPPMIQLLNCKNVLLEDFTSKNSPFWTIHLVYCDFVVVRNIVLLNPENAPNTDGLNLDSSTNVYIQGLFADVGDDAICIKSGMNEDGWRVGRPSENIVVENCHVKKGHGGIVFGSDMSGGIRNVFVRNCEYDGTLMGIRMKSMRGRGGTIEKVWIQDIKMNNIGWHAIILNMFYGASSATSRSDTPPQFRDIHIKNVTCQGARDAITLRGLPEKNIENITLENITITADNGLVASDAHAIELNNVNITPHQGAVMSLQDCRHFTIQGSGTPTDCDTFLHLKGEKTGSIRLIGNNLSNVHHEVIMEKEVPAGAVLINQDRIPDEAGTFDSFQPQDMNVLTGNANTLLLDYLLQQLDKHYDARRKTIEQVLTSQEKLLKYQQELRRKYHKLLGRFPEKTPLNACVTGVIECDGYRIEKVTYESRPNHHITANLYLPATGKGPFPGILVLCGHWANAKTIKEHQSICSLLAVNGMAALVVDPVSQGERYQLLTSDGKPANRGGTLSHTLLDIGANLAGTDIVAYEAWDNIRSIDYMVSRQEIDPEKIGCTGASGGGTQTTFLMALDDRIKAAAPACYICSVESNLKTLGSPDGCQQLAGDNALGIEQVSYLTMRAPKPTLIIAAERDFFPISATRETFKEAQRVYTTLGFPDHVAMFTADAEHGFNKAMREAAASWMRRWLLNDDRPVSEPEFTLHKENDLWVTTTGQVGSYFADEVNIADLNLIRAEELAQQRQRFWQENSMEQCLTQVRDILGLHDKTENPVVINKNSIRRKEYRIDKLIIQRQGEVPVPALLFVPDSVNGKLPATIYVNSSGKNSDAGPDGPIAKLVRQGRIVLAIDVRGWGETKGKGEKYQQKEFQEAMTAIYLARPLMGQRVEDILAALDILIQRHDVDPDKIDLTGIKHAGPVALHAAALDERFAGVTIMNSISAWIDVIKVPLAPDLISYCVPRALPYYDLPDLINAISPRSVHIIDAVALEQKVMDGEFWRDQVLTDLIPYWYKHVRDEEHGAFYLNLSRDWQPVPPWDKMPAMISRQIFSFSTAYLLSGEEKYLDVAREAVDYLLKYGWDQEYGGWYESISQTGQPKSTDKRASSQIYNNVGLTQYYFVTGDERALSHVRKSVEIHKTYSHDEKFDGYYMGLNRDLSIRDSSKAKHSHYGQGSLMPYLILATRDSTVISYSKHLADLSIERMYDPVNSWILGYPNGFGREWNYVPYLVDEKESIYLGACSTAALFFLHLYHLTGDESYLKHGKALGDKLCRYGWDKEQGNWFFAVEKAPPYHTIGSQKVYWWIQIYGAFLQLQLYHITQDEQYLENFKKTELFYDRYFRDRKYGGVFLGVDPNGSFLGKGEKAKSWHTSFHEIEHGFLNYLNLNLYVNKKPVVLHFKLDGPKKHFVSPLADSKVIITRVRINGKPWTSFDARERSITVPAGKNMNVEVMLNRF